MTFDPPCLFIYVISQGGPKITKKKKKKNYIGFQALKKNVN